MALHPVGPLPASTYWRRRLVLVVGLVVLLLVAKSCVGGSGGKPSPRANVTPTSTPHVGHTASPAPSPSPHQVATIGACSDNALRLTTSTDAPTYPVGSTARFTVTVKNTSTTSCRRDLGGAALEVVVKSGPERIWSNLDCGTHTGTSLELLRPGGSLQTTVTWVAGQRSAHGCPSPANTSGAGTYTVTARLGTLTGVLTVFQLRA